MSIKKFLIALAALAVLIVAFYASDFLRSKYVPANNAPAVNTNTANNESDQKQTKLATYTNTQYGFSFSYPRDFFTPTAKTVYLPFGTNSAVSPVVALKHEINAQYCALSGKCQPTTIDISMGAVVINQSMPAIRKLIDAEQELKTEVIGNVQAEVLQQGVEGEGMYYYFISLPNDRTLMVYQSYIDESILAGYQKIADFTPFAKQTQIAKEVISSIKIQ